MVRITKRPVRLSLVAAALVWAGYQPLESASAPLDGADPALRAVLTRAPGWSEDFAKRPSKPDWSRGYNPWPNMIVSRILPSGEVEIYTDTPYLNRDLLMWQPGQVKLVAEPMTPDERNAIAQRVVQEKVPERWRPAVLGASWVSTLLKGAHAFEYGYFESRIRSGMEPSEWDAFWLLPEKRAWPPEIDIMEIPGDQTAHQTLHTLPGDPRPHPTVKTPIGPGFHTYGVLWRPDIIAFYVDRHETACFRTPSDMHQPMYPLLNLAVGGWARRPDERTAPRMSMDVNYVRWWPLPPVEAASPGSAPADCPRVAD